MVSNISSPITPKPIEHSTPTVQKDMLSDGIQANEVPALSHLVKKAVESMTKDTIEITPKIAQIKEECLKQLISANAESMHDENSKLIEQTLKKLPTDVLLSEVCNLTKELGTKVSNANDSLQSLKTERAELQSKFDSLKTDGYKNAENYLSGKKLDKSNTTMFLGALKKEEKQLESSISDLGLKAKNFKKDIEILEKSVNVYKNTGAKNNAAQAEQELKNKTAELNKNQKDLQKDITELGKIIKLEKALEGNSEKPITKLREKQLATFAKTILEAEMNPEAKEIKGKIAILDKQIETGEIEIKKLINVKNTSMQIEVSTLTEKYKSYVDEHKESSVEGIQTSTQLNTARSELKLSEKNLREGKEILSKQCSDLKAQIAPLKDMIKEIESKFGTSGMAKYKELNDTLDKFNNATGLRFKENQKLVDSLKKLTDYCPGLGGKISLGELKELNNELSILQNNLQQKETELEEIQKVEPSPLSMETDNPFVINKAKESYSNLLHDMLSSNKTVINEKENTGICYQFYQDIKRATYTISDENGKKDINVENTGSHLKSIEILKEFCNNDPKLLFLVSQFANQTPTILTNQAFLENEAIMVDGQPVFGVGKPDGGEETKYDISKNKQGDIILSIKYHTSVNGLAGMFSETGKLDLDPKDNFIENRSTIVIHKDHTFEVKDISLSGNVKLPEQKDKELTRQMEDKVIKTLDSTPSTKDIAQKMNAFINGIEIIKAKYPNEAAKAIKILDAIPDSINIASQKTPDLKNIKNKQKELEALKSELLKSGENIKNPVFLSLRDAMSKELGNQIQSLTDCVYSSAIDTLKDADKLTKQPDRSVAMLNILNKVTGSTGKGVTDEKAAVDFLKQVMLSNVPTSLKREFLAKAESLVGHQFPPLPIKTEVKTDDPLALSSAKTFYSNELKTLQNDESVKKEEGTTGVCVQFYKDINRATYTIYDENGKRDISANKTRDHGDKLESIAKLKEFCNNDPKLLFVVSQFASQAQMISLGIAFDMNGCINVDGQKAALGTNMDFTMKYDISKNKEGDIVITGKFHGPVNVATSIDGSSQLPADPKESFIDRTSTLIIHKKDYTVDLNDMGLSCGVTLLTREPEPEHTAPVQDNKNVSKNETAPVQDNIPELGQEADQKLETLYSKLDDASVSVQDKLGLIRDLSTESDPFARENALKVFRGKNKANIQLEMGKARHEIKSLQDKAMGLEHSLTLAEPELAKKFEKISGIEKQIDLVNEQIVEDLGNGNSKNLAKHEIQLNKLTDSLKMALEDLKNDPNAGVDKNAKSYKMKEERCTSLMNEIYSLNEKITGGYFPDRAELEPQLNKLAKLTDSLKMPLEDLKKISPRSAGVWKNIDNYIDTKLKINSVLETEDRFSNMQPSCIIDGTAADFILRRLEPKIIKQEDNKVMAQKLTISLERLSSDRKMPPEQKLRVFDDLMAKNSDVIKADTDGVGKAFWAAKRQIVESMPPEKPILGEGFTIDEGPQPGSKVTLDGKEYRFKGELGRGAFGAVFRFEADDKSQIAIKKFSDSETAEQEIKMHGFVSRMASSNEENVVGYKGEILGNDGNKYLAMDFVNGGDIEGITEKLNVLKTDHVLSHEDDVFLRRYLTKGILDGMIFLNDSSEIMHSDLKPANVMYDRTTGKVKVADLGLAIRTEVAVSKDAIRGTTRIYTSPESVQNPDLVDKRIDSFAFGQTLHNIMTGQLAVLEGVVDMLDMRNTMIAFGKGDKPARTVGDIAEPTEFGRVVNRTMEGKIDNRARLSEIRENPLFTEVDSPHDTEKARRMLDAIFELSDLQKQLAKLNPQADQRQINQLEQQIKDKKAGMRDMGRAIDREGHAKPLPEKPETKEEVAHRKKLETDTKSFTLRPELAGIKEAAEKMKARTALISDEQGNIKK